MVSDCGSSAVDTVHLVWIVGKPLAESMLQVADLVWVAFGLRHD